VLLIVDRLQDVVNTLGHPTGDDVLRQVGPRLRAALGPYVLIARVGGGEFAAAIPSRGPDDPAPMEAARFMHATMTEPFVVGDLHVEPGGSVGFARAPDQTRDPDGLIRFAGVAATAARLSGADVVAYSPAADPWTSRRLRLAGSVRGGIRNGEMTMLYQPKVVLRTGRPAGAEALVRWHHPELGLVAPVEFIGLAEQTGAIRPLTRWVVEQAAACSARLARAGTPTRISANVSALDLGDPEFATEIEGVLAATGVAPSGFELEITETLLLADPTAARGTLTALRKMGISLSIDDFGTGYCSLGYLRDLPVDIIKIDKGFVAGGPGPVHDPAITRSIIELGHNLGLEVLAEGVASSATERVLRDLGCDIGQGELYGNPMDEGAFSGWLQRALAREPA
jgi:diguanylate cyclase (GGDEF)-like protein